MIADMSCVFCSIAAGDIPADRVLETGGVIAFRDLHPVAPVHVLVIPRAHHRNVAELSGDAEAMAEVMRAVAAVAEQEGLGNGFRVVFNTGGDAGQEVDHVHAHVLGGRRMQWPPG
jgi:histidine triad (HIT) family protein